MGTFKGQLDGPEKQKKAVDLSASKKKRRLFPCWPGAELASRSSFLPTPNIFLLLFGKGTVKPSLPAKPCTPARGEGGTRVIYSLEKGPLRPTL